MINCSCNGLEEVFTDALFFCRNYSLLGIVALFIEGYTLTMRVYRDKENDNEKNCKTDINYNCLAITYFGNNCICFFFFEYFKRSSLGGF